MALIDVSDADIDLLLTTLYRLYGYDFRQYSEAHVRRRIVNRLIMSDLRSAAAMIERVQHDRSFVALLLQDLSINVTEMFRDPDFYRSLRENVIPILKTYSFIKIWHAGCSTGEEAYSMAILLKEEGLYDRTTIYASDFNQRALDQAREGMFSNDVIRDYTYNYQKSGGQEAFSDYYTAQYNMVIMDQSLKKNIVWANHNLVTDSVFAEVHLILCRNVLIYFNRDLQHRVQGLFHDSLINGGLLALGIKESLRFGDFAERYVDVDKKHKIFKKKY